MIRHKINLLLIDNKSDILIIKDIIILQENNILNYARCLVMK